MSETRATQHVIADAAALERLYGLPSGAAVEKEVSFIWRSKLWEASSHIDRKSLPSFGGMIAGLSESRIDASTYDKGLYDRLKASLY